MQTRNPRGRSRAGRRILPPITGRNRTKTGKSHNPGFARRPARAIVMRFAAPWLPHAEEPRAARRLEAWEPSPSFETRARTFQFATALGARALLRMKTAEPAARRRTVFGNSHLTMSNSPDLLVPAAHFCARGLQLRFTHLESRGGRSAEKRSGAAAPVGRALGASQDARERAYDAARQAPSEAPCVP